MTDNAANFVKAFKEFNICVCVDDEHENNYEDVSFITIDTDSEDNGIILPPHLKCACHTLSLVATSDAKNAFKESPTISRLNNLAMGKCSALWNASGKPKTAELISDELSRRIICATRWNSH